MAKTQTKAAPTATTATPAASQHDVSLLERIKLGFELDQPILLVGPPGVGKSQRTRRAAEMWGGKFVDVRLALYDPVDVRGLPFIPKEQQDMICWAKPDFVRQAQTGEKTVLCYEEINCASVSTMNTALQFILDRRLGEHELGPNVRQIACVNRAEHQAHVNPMSAPLINRFIVMEVGVSRDEFMSYAINNNMHDAVIGYINFRPDALLMLPKDRGDEFQNFPTPRSWERISKLLHAGCRDRQMITGSIGTAAAIEFIQFMEERDEMPDLNRLLAGKLEFDFTKAKISVQYATVAALATRCTQDCSDMEAAGRVISSPGMKEEIAALFFALIMKSELKDPAHKIASCRSLTDWMTRHSKLISAAIR